MKQNPLVIPLVGEAHGSTVANRPTCQPNLKTPNDIEINFPPHMVKRKLLIIHCIIQLIDHAFYHSSIIRYMFFFELVSLLSLAFSTPDVQFK